MRVFERGKLVDDLLLVDGVTRAGKFLLADLLASCKNVEHVQYFGLFEHLAYMVRMGVIEKETSSAILQCQIDNSAYDLMFGRNLNSRLGDKSSIYRSPHLKEYLRRTLEDDGDRVTQEIKKRERYFTYIVHETLPNIDVYLDIYPDLRVINIERNPVDLVYSWYQRGWGKRWGVDPIDFSMSFQGARGPIPWFVYQVSENWESASEMDKIIIAQTQVYEMSKKKLSSLSESDRKKILFTSYEGIVTQPLKEIKAIAGFLDREVLPIINGIMAREDIPNVHPREKRSKKIDVVRDTASEECFELLHQLNIEYENNGGILTYLK